MATAAWYRKRVGTVLNVMGTSAGAVAVPTSTDDPAYPDEEIDEKVIMAANAVIGLVASIPNHPFIRALISESSNIAHGGQLPAHIGPIYAVRVSINGTTAFNPAIPDAPDAVQRRIDDATTLSLGLDVRYYAIDGERLYHTGAQAKVDSISLASLSIPTDVPDALSDCVVALALAFLLPLEGVNVAGGGHFSALAYRHIELQAQLARDAIAAARAFQFNPFIRLEWTK
jgi:hypothetical protein